MSEEKKAAVVRYHKKTLLEAADRLLVQYGYDGMNMNMLAKEAGYSKATVYVYFSGKDEIVRLLCVDRLTLFRREVGVILKNDMPLSDKLAAVKSLLDEFATDDRVYFDFICRSEFAGLDSTDSERALSDLVNGILFDLASLAPEAQLKSMWYAYYGELVTSKMFASGGTK